MIIDVLSAPPPPPGASMPTLVTTSSPAEARSPETTHAVRNLPDLIVHGAEQQPLEAGRR